MDDIKEVRSQAELRRIALHAVTRAAISISLLVAVYFIVPFGSLNSSSGIVRFVIALAIVTAVTIWEIRSITTSPMPDVRALEAVSISVPLFILTMAAVYVVMSQTDGQSFSESLTRVDGLYFAITVFTTVGFGDIGPVSQVARIAVTIQMVLNVLLLGLGVRVVVFAINVGKQRQHPSE